MNVLEMRPAPTPEQQAQANARVQWDVPVGSAHAYKLLDIIQGRAA